MEVVISVNKNLITYPNRSGLGLLASAHFCNSPFWVTSLPLSNIRSLTIRLIYNSLGSSNPQVEPWIRQSERKKKKDELKDPRTGKFAKTWNYKEGKAIYIGFQKAVSFLNLHPCTMSDFHIFGLCKEGMMVSHPHMVYTFFLNVFHQL